MFADALPTAIVIFRETFEIALIVGIVLAATKGLAGRGKWIWLGLFAGTAGAGMIAIFAETISNAAEGMGQELFNAGILAIAALFIGWTVIWMSTHARQMVAEIKTTGRNIIEGKSPTYMLAIIIGIAMLREGAEIVLFTYGMIASGQQMASIVSGSVVGVAAGSAIGLAIYFGLVSIPTKYVFRVTSWLLIALVAGLAAQSVGFITQAGYFESLSDTVWDSSFLISDESVTGQVLHSLAGYSAQPSLIQVIVYFSALAVMIASVLLLSRKTTGNSGSAMPKAA